MTNKYASKIDQDMQITHKTQDLQTTYKALLHFMHKFEKFCGYDAGLQKWYYYGQEVTQEEYDRYKKLQAFE